MATVISLKHLNALSAPDFVIELGSLFEHSPWVAERIALQRPFASARALHDTMVAAVKTAGTDVQRSLIQAHPELAGKEAIAGAMTADSTSEQSRLGLTRLARGDFERLADLNRRYRERFGMPCIIALRRHQSLASVLDTFEQRLAQSPDREIATALDEIAHITEGRLEARLDLAGGRLTTHVLDTTTGLPAAGMAYDLSIARDDGWKVVATGVTNAQGRTDRPLQAGLDMAAARYRLAFRAGDYYRARGVSLAEPAFLDIIPIEFGIGKPGQHYHVPLLCTPWSYSTYRGS